ncbi:hypothetical protein [Roseococcus sp. YIM B11640]|uniref:hypothetical protein n=1 Tax=Roseococcus sp. YIM B11640 TaxID=3133973 RepID=UPI003C7B3D61
MAKEPDVARVAAAFNTPGLKYRSFGNLPVRNDSPRAETLADPEAVLRELRAANAARDAEAAAAAAAAAAALAQASVPVVEVVEVIEEAPPEALILTTPIAPAPPVAAAPTPAAEPAPAPAPEPVAVTPPPRRIAPSQAAQPPRPPVAPPPVHAAPAAPSPPPVQVQPRPVSPGAIPVPPVPEPEPPRPEPVVLQPPAPAPAPVLAPPPAPISVPAPEPVRAVQMPPPPPPPAPPAPLPEEPGIDWAALASAAHPAPPPVRDEEARRLSEAEIEQAPAFALLDAIGQVPDVPPTAAPAPGGTLARLRQVIATTVETPVLSPAYQTGTASKSTQSLGGEGMVPASAVTVPLGEVMRMIAAGGPPPASPVDTFRTALRSSSSF